MSEPPMNWTILVEFPDDSLEITIDDARRLRLQPAIHLSFVARQRLSGMIVECMARYEAVNPGEDTPLAVICDMVRRSLWMSSYWSNREHRVRDYRLVDELRAALAIDVMWLEEVSLN